MSMIINAAEDADVTKTVEANRVVLVDFWGDNCAKCRLMAPILDEISLAHPDTVKIVAMNVADSATFAEEHRVATLPTMKLFVDGECVHTITGALPRRALQEQIATALAPFGLELASDGQAG